MEKYEYGAKSYEAFKEDTPIINIKGFVVEIGFNTNVIGLGASAGAGKNSRYLRLQKGVVDLGSTKKELCLNFNTHAKRGNYVSAHPIAGTENSGPKAACSNLYKNKKVVVCEKNLSSDQALSVAIEMFNKIGMSCPKLRLAISSLFTLV